MLYCETIAILFLCEDKRYRWIFISTLVYLQGIKYLNLIPCPWDIVITAVSYQGFWYNSLNTEDIRNRIYAPSFKDQLLNHSWLMLPFWTSWKRQKTKGTLKWKHWSELGLTLSWRKPLSYRNQFIDLQSKSMNWFLYDNGLRHERVKQTSQTISDYKRMSNIIYTANFYDSFKVTTNQAAIVITSDCEGLRRTNNSGKNCHLVKIESC